jgi:hypothetical protein
MGFSLRPTTSSDGNIVNIGSNAAAMSNNNCSGDKYRFKNLPITPHVNVVVAKLVIHYQMFDIILLNVAQQQPTHSSHSAAQVASGDDEADEVNDIMWSLLVRWSPVPGTGCD